MRLVARLVCNTPHAPHIASARIDRPLHPDTVQSPIVGTLAIECPSTTIPPESQLGIRLELLLEIISLRLCKEEHLFEVHRETIPHGGGHAGRLMPYDLVAQHPTSQDHFVGEFVRNVAERLRGKRIRGRHLAFARNEITVIAAADRLGTLLFVAVLLRVVVGIAQVHPQRAGGFQHAAALVENHAQMRNEIVARRLQSQLPRPAVRPHDRADAVVAHLPIGRRSDDAVHRLVGQQT